MNLKKESAYAALEYMTHVEVVGVGSGSTVAYFIEALGTIKGRLDGAVASSETTAALLKQQGIPVLDLNSVDSLSVYVDGADAFTQHKYLIKGGGGALTREKIIAQVAQQFICIVDDTKQVDVLGGFPVAIEVIPMARSAVAREIVKLHGYPVYRQGYVTDNGHIIIDVHGWNITDPVSLEQTLNNIPGVVTNGIFARRLADIILIAKKDGVSTLI